MRNAPFSKKKKVHPSVPKLNRLPVPTHSPPFNTHRRKKIPYDSQKFRSSNLSSKFPPYIITFLKIGKLKSNFHPHTHWRKHNPIHTETPTTPHPHTHTHKTKKRVRLFHQSINEKRKIFTWIEIQLPKLRPFRQKLSGDTSTEKKNHQNLPYHVSMHTTQIIAMKNGDYKVEGTIRKAPTTNVK